MIALNTRIHAELEKIAEVASYLWQKNWAEANGGNISVNLTPFAGKSAIESSDFIKTIKMEQALPSISGNLFFVSGKGKRMRDIAKAPLDFGTIIRVSAGGSAVEVIHKNKVEPTSELPSHLCIHDFLARRSSKQRAVLHSHPTELIALSHCEPFRDSARLTQTLWAMIPEARVLIPKGLGVVPYALTGTTALAHATIKQLEKHDVVVWEKHGVLAIGSDIMDCFDVLDTLSKSARIYLLARNAGFEPQGLSKKQLDELAEAFNLPPA